MACAKCDFYTPKDSSKAQILEAKENLQKMRAMIPLTEDEQAAVDDGNAALDRLLDRLADSHQHADHGHLRRQHPVVLMPGRRFPQRAGDHVLGEQLFQQALPVQFRQSVRPNPGPDAIRAAISAASSLPLPPCGAAGVDAGPMTMANLALNKAPGGRKGCRQPRSYQELCSISWTTGSVTPPRSTCRQTVTSPRKPDTRPHKYPISPETLGQWGRASCSPRVWPPFYFPLRLYRIIMQQARNLMICVETQVRPFVRWTCL
jgi:hypothetical protein